MIVFARWCYGGWWLVGTGHWALRQVELRGGARPQHHLRSAATEPQMPELRADLPPEEGALEILEPKRLNHEGSTRNARSSKQAKGTCLTK